jgi:hypothetical protein
MTTSAPLRLDLDPLPARMRLLPLDARKIPVPWFVAWENGVPEFRAMDPLKWRLAMSSSLCWVCGQALGRHRIFVIGPMCAINRTTSEPPCHLECAEWSARNCPFLSRPSMRRQADSDERLQETAAGLPIARNPGVTLLWCTRRGGYYPFATRNGSLIRLAEPDRVVWFAEKRPATRAEVLASIAGGLPILRDQAAKDGPDALRQLDRMQVLAERWYPTA